MRKTKIVATVGPACDDPGIMAELMLAGMDVARLNFSHGDHEQHRRRIDALRQAARKTGKQVALLQDLQGPKIRTGALAGGKPVQLPTGGKCAITARETAGSAALFSTTYAALPGDVRPGDRILVSDGLIELRVLSASGDTITTEIINGGELRERQGLNLPGVKISSPALTAKDAADLEFGLAHDVDCVALSFVRCAADIRKVKDHIAAAGKDTPVIAKIEKPEALEDISAILAEADGLMVARGDLGVEISPEQVPQAQKQLIQACNAAGIPVITATQMLESMIHSPRPTRAEASDVANAILDGTDAVMLSGETAVGSFPLEAVRMMARIAAVTESSRPQHHHKFETARKRAQPQNPPEAIAAAACAIERVLPVKAIVPFTRTGNTARLVARMRPNAPIVAITPSEQTCRRLAFVWGVIPILSRQFADLQELGEIVNRTLPAHDLGRVGDLVVVTGGHPVDRTGSTNILKIFQING
ncbi:MAG: pyruvate kinase [Acidobacteria bacterium]|nr:pyruvate kinase [Acidobacteriota bacterium]